MMNASRALVAFVVVAVIVVTAYGLLNGTIIKKEESHETAAGAAVAGAGPEAVRGAGPGNGGLGELTVDTAKLLDLDGEVVSADLSSSNHFVLKAGETVYDVNVGARWYWEYKGIELNPGDRVKVTGFNVEGLPSPTLAASTVANRETGRDIRVRGDDGAPVWRDETEGECKDDGIGGFGEQ